MKKNIIEIQRSPIHFLGPSINTKEIIPFKEIFSSSMIKKWFEQQDIEFRSRIFTPLVTLWIFMTQALDKDKSCSNAIKKFNFFRSQNGQEECSPKTGSYVKARMRLPLQLIIDLVKKIGELIINRSEDTYTWFGRKVKMFDGTTFSMPDTQENQDKFPQTTKQKQGVGFPLGRLVVEISLATGSVLDGRISAWKGKGNGETTLFRNMLDKIEKGDVLLFDSNFTGFFDSALAMEKGADIVGELKGVRKNGLEQKKRLGPGEYLVTFKKSDIRCPQWLEKEIEKELPEQIIFRIIEVAVVQKGFRPSRKKIITTLLDIKKYPKKDISDLYRSRWCVETDLKMIKDTMSMGVLSCKTPEMIKKEVWVYLLAYNLVRLTMAQAAIKNKCDIREISFKGALDYINIYRFEFHRNSPLKAKELYIEMLEKIGMEKVKYRPGRFEPRAVKRRPKPFAQLDRPRKQARKKLYKRTRLLNKVA